MSVRLGPLSIPKGRSASKEGALGAHGCETEVLSGITRWNGREWRRELFLTGNSGLQGGSWSFWMASAGTLSVGPPPGPSCPPQISFCPFPPPRPLCHPVLWPHHGPHHTVPPHSIQLLSPLEIPFLGSGLVSLPSRLFLPFTYT